MCSVCVCVTSQCMSVVVWGRASELGNMHKHVRPDDY